MSKTVQSCIKCLAYSIVDFLNFRIESAKGHNIEEVGAGLHRKAWALPGCHASQSAGPILRRQVGKLFAQILKITVADPQSFARINQLHL